MKYHVVFLSEGYFDYFIGPFETLEETDAFMRGARLGASLYSGSLGTYIMETDQKEYEENFEEEYSQLKIEGSDLVLKFTEWKQDRAQRS